MVRRRKRDFTFHTPSPPPCFQDGIVPLVIMLAFQEQALKFDWLFCFNVAFSLAGNLKSDRLFCLSVAFSLAGKKMRFKRFIKEYIAQLSHQQFKMEKFDNYPSSKLHIINHFPCTLFNQKFGPYPGRVIMAASWPAKPTQTKQARDAHISTTKRAFLVNIPCLLLQAVSYGHIIK